MNNGNASYAQMRAGSISGPDLSSFKQNASFKAPEAPSMAGFQKENLSSGSFTFRSADVNPGKVASYSKYQRSTIYGAGTDTSSANPANPGGK
jgi:hypothetical protein